MLYFLVFLFFMYFGTGLVCNIIKLYEFFKNKDDEPKKHKLEENK